MSHAFPIIGQAVVSHRVQRGPWVSRDGLQNYPGHGKIMFATDELEEHDGCDIFWLLIVLRSHRPEAYDDFCWLYDNRVAFTVSLSVEFETRVMARMRYAIVFADKKDAALFKLFRR